MMDRNPPETEGVLSAKSNGQKNTTKPFGIRHPLRKSSGNPESKENSITSDTEAGWSAIPRLKHTSSNIPRHRQSESLIARPSSMSPSPSLGGRNTSIFATSRYSRDTRIPRPQTTDHITNNQSQNIPIIQDQSPDQSSPMRQPMSLSAAFKRAQEQTAAESTSDSDSTVDLRQAFNMANAEFDGRGIDGSPSPAPRPYRREVQKAIPSRIGAGKKDNDLNKHLQQFDHNHQLASGGGPLNGLFNKNRAGPKVSETGRVLVQNANNNNLDGDPDGSPERHGEAAQTAKPRNQEDIITRGTSAGRLPAMGAHSDNVHADVPVPSIEYESTSEDRPSPGFQLSNISPEKSMNWHLDADFTAGDLQFSQSPRVTLGKMDSDASRQSGNNGHAPIGTSSSCQQSNNKLSQIHQKEIEAAKTNFAEDTSVGGQMNRRLDEIKAREAEALSRRAIASSRLDEIRIKNSEPRSTSPETRKGIYKGSSKEGSAPPNVESQDASNHILDPESIGEPISGTPVVVYKNSSDRTLRDRNQETGKQNDGKRDDLSRSVSHDLLRRLARATSSSPKENEKTTEQVRDSPSPEKPVMKQLSDQRNINHSPLIREERRSRNLGVKNTRDRPTVGFADMMRKRSSDSISGKATSKPNSDIDPTDRIAAELNLFAPMDNYSERGSIRAPSPAPSELMGEETPRPAKMDPLTQPTPRVTGAYIDTPATVRHVKTENPAGAPQQALETVPAAQGRNSSLSPTKRSMNHNVTGRARSLKRSGPRSSSVPTASRRVRSSSRRRRPLINTAKPPTVKEDILAILQANEIDDSTLENIDLILANREVGDQELKQMVNDTILKVEDDLEIKFSDMTDRERELEAYDRMSKSLKTGLLGIRSAKKGIERLEDKVTHSDRKDDQLHPEVVSSANPVLQPSLASYGTSPVFISVPRLYRRNPKFKLTPLGIFAIWVAIWYAFESAFCHFYAAPEYACTPNVPCDWSPNEPYFPYTMPFMLDEWATGGKGRALVLRAGEEVGDIWAEVSDWATNTDFTKFDQRYMDVWQRKRHRRRLRKHGLTPKWTEPSGYHARYPEWQAAEAVRESAQELGVDEEDETMSADEEQSSYFF